MLGQESWWKDSRLSMIIKLASTYPGGENDNHPYIKNVTTTRIQRTTVEDRL